MLLLAATPTLLATETKAIAGYRSETLYLFALERPSLVNAKLHQGQLRACHDNHDGPLNLLNVV